MHVWTPNTESYPLDSSYDVSDMQPASFTPEQLFAHCRPAGVGRIVLIQMSFYNFDNRYMLDMIAAHEGVFSGVGMVDASRSRCRREDEGVGSSRRPRVPLALTRGRRKEWITDDGMATVWRTAREHDLAVCPLIDPADIPHVDALCKKFPGTRVVVDHFARVGISGEIVPGELEALCGLSRHRDVHVKTSGFLHLARSSRRTSTWHR